MNEETVIKAILQVVTAVATLEEATDALLQSVPVETLQKVLTQEEKPHE